MADHENERKRQLIQPHCFFYTYYSFYTKLLFFLYKYINCSSSTVKSLRLPLDGSAWYTITFLPHFVLCTAYNRPPAWRQPSIWMIYNYWDSLVKKRIFQIGSIYFPKCLPKYGNKLFSNYQRECQYNYL